MSIIEGTGCCDEATQRGGVGYLNVSHRSGVTRPLIIPAFYDIANEEFLKDFSDQKPLYSDSPWTNNTSPSTSKSIGL